MIERWISKEKSHRHFYADDFHGEGGIRTPDDVAATPVFKTGAINRSATSPNCFKKDNSYLLFSQSTALAKQVGEESKKRFDC